MNRLATAVLAALALTGSAAEASAAPQQIQVRTEGRDRTLFEGRIVTDGRTIRASSDSQSRLCDGTNNGANATPGPTPTAATVDALATIGETFDGQWYPGFDDYFVTRFGPDAQSDDAFAYWGLLVNRVQTSVGGCQYRLSAGDLALWVYDAFNGRPLLRLDGPSGRGEPTAVAEGAPPTAVQGTFTVAPGQPFPVSVVRASGTGDEAPAAGVGVSPVSTDGRGIQTVLAADAATVTTDGAGRATLSWSTPGWKRIKASAHGHVRSNRLDVCVKHAGVEGCPSPPPDAGVRTPPPSSLPRPSGRRPGDGSLAVGRRRVRELRAGAVRLGRPRITADGNPTGLVSVRWSLLAGAGSIRSIDVESRLPGARWVRRERVTTRTSVLLDLPVARLSEIRLRVTAKMGERAAARLGGVLVPRDERVREVRFRGRRERVRDPRAWRQTLTTLQRGARLTTRLPAGRPTLVVRGRRSARVEIRAAGRRRVVRVAGRRDGATRFVRGPARRRAGAVRFRVLRGRAGVDGVAASP
jgi:hypothetical protein